MVSLASTPQVMMWLNQGLDMDDGSARTAAGGSMHSAGGAQYSARFLGGPAASGARQVLITCPDQPSACLVFAVVWRWWVPVPTEVDARGWRFVSCRWMQ